MSFATKGGEMCFWNGTFSAFAQNCRRPTGLWHMLHNVQNRWWMGSCNLFSIFSCCIYDPLKVSGSSFQSRIGSRSNMFGNLAMARPVSFWWDIVQYLFGDRELKQLPLCLNCLPLYRGGRFSAQLVLSGSLLPLQGVIIFSVIIALFHYCTTRRYYIILSKQQHLHLRSPGRRISWG